MKKLLRYGSVLVLAMAFAACGSNGDDGDNQGGKDANVTDQWKGYQRCRPRWW